MNRIKHFILKVYSHPSYRKLLYVVVGATVFFIIEGVLNNKLGFASLFILLTFLELAIVILIAKGIILIYRKFNKKRGE